MPSKQKPMFLNLEAELKNAYTNGDVKFVRTFCGPTCLLLLTGASYEDIKEKINRFRNKRAAQYWKSRGQSYKIKKDKRRLTQAVKGLEHETMIHVLTQYGIKPQLRLIAKKLTLKTVCADLEYVARNKKILFSTGNHYVILDNGRVYDTFQTEGCPAAEHPFAKTLVYKYWILEGTNKSLFVDHALNVRYPSKTSDQIKKPVDLRPKKDIRAERQARAIAQHEKWSRKAKAAAKLQKKWAAKVRYYAKVLSEKEGAA